MTTTVSATGHTIVPKELRDRFKIKPGTTLEWQDDGDALRVFKVSHTKVKNGFKSLRQLGRLPAPPRGPVPRHD